MRICPKCGGKFDRLLAVSRIDNKTMLCNDCGTREAVEAMEGKIVSKWQALKAYNLLKQYCGQGNCKGCLFEMEENECTDCLLIYESSPDRWPELELEVDESEIERVKGKKGR